MKTITFYSYKGGVGRSLALANIALRLAEYGRNVCVLDFDLEAPGLQHKFSGFLSNQEKKVTNGIVDYVHQFSKSGIVSKSIRDYCYQFLGPGFKSYITLIPAGNTDAPNSEYWKKLSGINWYELLYENESGLSFILDLKEKIRSEIAPDFLLIDSRTGVSEMSGITLSLLADDVVIVAANNRENLEGAKKIIKTLSDPKNIVIGDIPKITFVLSRVPFTEKQDDRIREQLLLAKIKKEMGDLITDINLLHSDRDLEENEQFKIGYEKDESDAQISRDYRALFDKLTLNEFSDLEKENFRKIRESERFYQKALSESTVLKKLEFVSKAIALNPYKVEYFLMRASIFERLKAYDQGIDDCDAAILRDTKNLLAYEFKAKLLIKIGKIEEAKKSLKIILDWDNNYVNALYGLAYILTREKNYSEALYYFNKMIDLDAENYHAYNGRGNILRLTGNYFGALEDVYKSLEINVNYEIAYLTLAEINASLNNKHEFYLNLEKALSIEKALTQGTEKVEEAIKTEDVYKVYLNDERFLNIIARYDIHLENEH